MVIWVNIFYSGAYIIDNMIVDCAGVIDLCTGKTVIADCSLLSQNPEGGYIIWKSLRQRD